MPKPPSPRPLSVEVMSILLLMGSFPLLSGLSVCFAQETPITPIELDNFTMYYYKDPQPAEAPRMLRHFLEERVPSDKKFQQDAHTLKLMAYFFGRIAQGHPNIVREYEKLFLGSSEAAQLVLLTAFSLCGDDLTAGQLRQWLADSELAVNRDWIEQTLDKWEKPLPDPMALDVVNPWVMDQLWMEFFITGETKFVEKIVEVRDGPDMMRERLESWFQTHESDEDRKSMVQALSDMNIDYDRSISRIVSEDDLDIHFGRIAGGAGMAGDTFPPLEELRRLLNHSGDELTAMAMRAAADWALTSNCQQHPQLAGFCPGGG